VGLLSAPEVISSGVEVGEIGGKSAGMLGGAGVAVGVSVCQA